MIEVPVYLPNDASPSLSTVARGSGIVGRPAQHDADLIVIYYEGNIYGASNIVTWTDRAMLAYYRMRERYPTVAMMAVGFHHLHRIGTLYPEYGRIDVLENIAAVARWLDLDVTAEDFSQRMVRELWRTGERRAA